MAAESLTWITESAGISYLNAGESSKAIAITASPLKGHYAHHCHILTMADDEVDVEAVAALRKKRQFRKFTFRGLELERLLDLSHEELLGFVTARARRRMQRGLKRKPMALIKKLRKAKAGKFLKYDR